MFGIGMPEMLLLLAVALIVFGPKKLPELAKSLGRALGEFKRATSDLKETTESEAGLGEVRDNFRDVAKEIKKPAKLVDDAANPEPVDGTEPASPAESENASPNAAAPQEKVKAAFEELNSGEDEPMEISEAGDSGPADTTARRSRDDASS